METGIGAILREARKRRELDLADVEAAIKIRVRYLRAIEDEDWDLLPGDAYARGFVRTYANHLGLDGERLADEFRRGRRAVDAEQASRGVHPVAVGDAGRRRRLAGRALTLLVPLALVAILVAIGLSGEDDSGSSSPAAGQERPTERSTEAGEDTTAATRPGVSLSIEATDEVWVCLLDGRERPLVDGEILTAGAEAGPFRDEAFSAAFGNGEVELSIDGRQADTPASASPIGYRIEPGGDLTPLEEGERPDCE